MSNWLTLTLTFFLFAYADIPRVNSLRPPAKPIDFFPSGEEIPIFPNAPAGTDEQGESKAQNKPKSATLQEGSKLELIRYVSGEFAKAVK